MIVRTLWEYRRLTAGWSAAAAAFTVGYLAIYDEMAEDAEGEISGLPVEVGKLLGTSGAVTPEGYLEVAVYGLLPPLLLVMCAVGLGARAIAGLEESGELELHLAGPMSRTRLLFTRYIGFALAVTVVGGVIWAVVQVMVLAGGMRVPWSNLAAASVGLLLVGLVFGTLAFAAGAVTGDRAVALVLAGGLAAATYAVRALANTVDATRDLRWLSPFHYYLGGDPLRAGWNLGYEGVLVALIVAMLAVAHYGFVNRDIGSSQW